MVVAVGTAILFLTGLIPIGTYALPALSGFLLTAVVIELGSGWAWTVYAVISVLSVMIVPDKDAVLIYILFFGCYPILKALFEKLRVKYAVPAVKAAFFNLAALLYFFGGVWLFRIQLEKFNTFGRLTPLYLLAAANVAFWIYDYAFSLLISAYLKRMRPHLQKWFPMK